MALVGADVFSVTAGGEGSIFVWKFDAVQLKFNHLLSLEGHLRGVTGLIIQGMLCCICTLSSDLCRFLPLVVFPRYYNTGVGA